MSLTRSKKEVYEKWVYVHLIYQMYIMYVSEKGVHIYSNMSYLLEYET